MPHSTKFDFKRFYEYKNAQKWRFLGDFLSGSGNFLTETYLSLRRLENEAIKGIMQGQVVLDVGQVIQVGIE